VTANIASRFAIRYRPRVNPRKETSVRALFVGCLLCLSFRAPAIVQAGALPAQAQGAAADDVKPDEFGHIEKLPSGPRDHWLWVSDRVLRHNQLLDGDAGRLLGTLDVSVTLAGRLPVTSRELGEFYVVEPVYSRGHRGTRADYVTIYDSETLAYKDEIEIPPRAAETNASIAMIAMLDGGRFLVIYNLAPQSVTVVDVKLRRVASSIDTAGCACVYPTGERSFGTLCGDGTAVEVLLDEEGRQAGMRRSEKFFDVINDPLRENGVRSGKRWLFASFEGYLHDVDFSEDRPKVAARWSLFTDEERAANWRIGGAQHLGLHEKRAELYSIVHRGGPGTHKDAGEEIWVYDIAARQRARTIKAPSLVLAFVRPMLGIGRESSWFRALAYLQSAFGGPGIHSLVVTQDAEPLLFVRNAEIGAIGVLDARTGVMLREIEEVGVSGPNMAVP
jgi:methylamine dehydrogenase heavy chain